MVDFISLTLGLSFVIALRYLAVAGAALFYFWGPGSGRRAGARRLNARPPRRKDIRREILYALASAPIYAAPVALVLVLYRSGGTRLYLDPGAYGILWLPGSALVYLLAQDAYYYWLHRLLHHPRIFPFAHRGHHRSREPTPFASFAFDPLEAVLTAWFLPALTLLIPINLYVALALLLLMTAAAVFNHAGVEIWSEAFLKGPLGRHLITATHHDGHHRRLTSNYGLYLRGWDRLMKTDRERPAAAPAPSV